MPDNDQKNQDQVASKPQTPKGDRWKSPSLKSLLVAPLLSGYLLILLCFGGLGTWAATADIASAVIAMGVVSPEGSRKTIQHLEGGIIAEILVKGGDTVSMGEPLVVLQETQARASFEVLRGRRWLLESNIGRMRAEQSDIEALEFPQWMQDEAAGDAELKEILTAQQNLFTSRRELYAGRKTIGAKRIAQLEEEIAGLEAQIRSQRRQLRLIAEERVAKKQMLDQGLFPRPEYLALLRLEAEIQGDMAQNGASIARARQSIGETEMQIVNIDSERLDKISSELSETRSELDSIEQQLAARLDTLTRTTITAPVSGVVVKLRFHTTGGVVRPGDPILDIVPSDTDLLIDARVSPIDVDEVVQHQEARVVFSAFSNRNLPQIIGKIQSLSADSLVDEATGESYYLARVEVSEAELAKLGEGVSITPGMPAEVYIVTGERTMLQYLFKPLTDTLRRSFRES